MKKLILKPLIKGTLVLFPVLVTVWVIWSLVAWLDGLGRMALQPFMLDHLIFPGSGLVIMVVVLILVGLLFRFNYVNWMFKKIEHRLMKFPLVKTVYSAVKDLAGMFDNSQQKHQQVVLVDMQKSGLGFLIGMVTNDALPSAMQSSLPADVEHKPVAVYLPMSYMVGGYTIFTTTDKIKPIDWTFEEAMRFALTAGVSQKPESFAEKINKK